MVWAKPRQVLLLCAVGDLIGVGVAGGLTDRWLGSDLLRWPRLPIAQVLVRLGAAALATTLTVVLAYWLFNLPESFTLGHRPIQLGLLSSLSLWALALRLWLRLLPAHLPEEALTLEDVPWADSLSVQRQLKRTAAVAVATALLQLTLPLIALAGLLIWLEDRGPVLFYVQDRSGWMGEFFRLYKLRTMRRADPCEPASRTRRRDDRITRVGWVLRRVRLDELPLLLNVLRGDMSLIGPRPERPELEHELELRIPITASATGCPPASVATGLATTGIVKHRTGFSERLLDVTG